MDVSIPDDDAGIWFPPPLIFLGFILGGLAMDAIIGFLFLPIAPPLLWALATLAVLIGLWLVIGALALFKRAGTRPEPWQPSSALTTSGIYKRTRNPMYLGISFLHLAIAVAMKSLGALLLLLPATLVIDRMVIRREEAYLARRFGSTYMEYKARVRRWI